MLGGSCAHGEPVITSSVLLDLHLKLIANVLRFQTVVKDMRALTAVLQLRSSQVVRWKASDQDHPAIRTAGGAAQRP